MTKTPPIASIKKTKRLMVAQQDIAQRERIGTALQNAGAALQAAGTPPADSNN
jgi:hypothetical protein